MPKMNHLEKRFGREYRHGMWRTVYAEHRRSQGIWSAVFLLLALMLGVAMIAIPLVAVYGK